MGVNLACGIGKEEVGMQIAVGEVAGAGKERDECSVPSNEMCSACRARFSRANPRSWLRSQIHASEGFAGMARHRSTRFRSQIHPSEYSSGVARRRSPRLHPQIQPSEEGAGVTPRRSPRLHPQNRAREEGTGMDRRIRRRRGTSPADPASLPDDDDMLREILTRLPPEPSSLPRASAVCRRWLGLVTDPKFHRQFVAHHRRPPHLGVILWFRNQGIVFNPILDPPDRIPPARFSLGRYSSRDDDCTLFDCRHGLVLIADWARHEVAVCDPIAGEQRCVAVPSEMRIGYLKGAVLCAAGDHGHVHGSCRFNSCKLNLAVFMGPPCLDSMIYGNHQIIQAADGVVGYAALSYPLGKGGTTAGARKLNGISSPLMTRYHLFKSFFTPVITLMILRKLYN
ncbi:hypothetical protein QYE76_049715 [Lolium multiflorum]|uniref:F-box domain-containing protein n=1 Tax=Lolium multiflorum TaxID=4521 RepID=A0AAD8WH53_LOLMU|nr:hypothetical protein QYE76_049715 [Lolium multiflorum]